MKVLESNPTPPLPLPGERESASPCEGGGREGVAQNNKEAGDASANPDPTPTLRLSRKGENAACESESHVEDFSSPCKGGGWEGVAQNNKELGNASANPNPTPTLPLPGEGENAACESESHVEDFSSPCEGGGREGVVQTNQEMAGYLKELGYARS